MKSYYNTYLAEDGTTYVYDENWNYIKKFSVTPWIDIWIKVCSNLIWFFLGMLLNELSK